MMVGIVFGIVLAVGVACWWLLRRERAAQARAPLRSVLSNRDALRHWVRMHMPDLDAELGPLSMNQVRERLNAITGCNVSADGRIEDGCAVFLAALQAQYARKEAS